MSLLKRVEAELPATKRGKSRWVDRLSPADRADFFALRKDLHAGKRTESAAQLSRAISKALGGAVSPHTIVLWLHDTDRN